MDRVGHTPKWYNPTSFGWKYATVLPLCSYPFHSTVPVNTPINKPCAPPSTEYIGSRRRHETTYDLSPIFRFVQSS